MRKNEYSIVVLSCDRYEPCWKAFFTLLDKYFKDHPKVYLVTESKTCKYCDTINVDSNIWSVRFREALKVIPYDYVLVMLDDFFIRDYVDFKRIEDIDFKEGVICYNFEKNYREPLIHGEEWNIQRNNQVYLNSCQPSLWRKDLLIERLQEDKNPQEWELTCVNSPYVHYINNKDFIIDIGYRHQDLSIGFGITRGCLSRECKEFLESEGLCGEIVNHYPLL